MGRANAAVLPVPVSAMPSKSLPAASSGMVRAWIGVGSQVVFGLQREPQRLDQAEAVESG